MNDRQRFIGVMNYQPVDRPPLHLVGPWGETISRWRREGLPEGMGVHQHLGVVGMQPTNVSGQTGLWPPFETRVIREDDTFIYRIDEYGRTVKDFKDHVSMPEWEDFPVKSGEDLERVLDEHMDVSDMTARYDAAWEKRVRASREATAGPVIIDGGGFYWHLRSLAGVEEVSYLFYDAADLVEEFMERVLAVVLEGIERASRLTTIDAVGFGEDIAFKTGPLVSMDVFRGMILPRYRKAMDLAHDKGIALTWYDSDGNLNHLVNDYLSIGINCLAPCEVAADMAPADLRHRYGKNLRMIGGIDKRQIAAGQEAIDAELKRNEPIER
jgi:uroporphyrinogen decarboxylase